MLFLEYFSFLRQLNIRSSVSQHRLEFGFQ